LEVLKNEKVSSLLLENRDLRVSDEVLGSEGWLLGSGGEEVLELILRWVSIELGVVRILLRRNRDLSNRDLSENETMMGMNMRGFISLGEEGEAIGERILWWCKVPSEGVLEVLKRPVGWLLLDKRVLRLSDKVWEGLRRLSDEELEWLLGREVILRLLVMWDEVPTEAGLKVLRGMKIFVGLWALAQENLMPSDKVWEGLGRLVGGKNEWLLGSGDVLKLLVMWDWVPSDYALKVLACRAFVTKLLLAKKDLRLSDKVLEGLEILSDDGVEWLLGSGGKVVLALIMRWDEVPSEIGLGVLIERPNVARLLLAKRDLKLSDKVWEGLGKLSDEELEWLLGSEGEAVLALIVKRGEVPSEAELESIKKTECCEVAAREERFEAE